MLPTKPTRHTAHTASSAKHESIGGHLISLLVLVQVVGAQVLEAALDAPTHSHVSCVVGVSQTQAHIVDVAQGIWQTPQRLYWCRNAHIEDVASGLHLDSAEMMCCEVTGSGVLAVTMQQMAEAASHALKLWASAAVPAGEADAWSMHSLPAVWPAVQEASHRHR